MKQNIKRSIVYLLLGAMLLGVMTSCVFATPNGEDRSSATTEDPNTDPAYLELKDLLREDLSEYQIVRSDTMDSEETKMVLSFRQTLVKKSGSDITVVTDFEPSYPRKDKEIVIGKTTLEGKHYTLPEASKNLAERTYAIDIVGTRVILSYADDVGLKDGLEFLVLAMVAGDATDLKNAFSDALRNNGIPRFEDFSLNNYFMDGMKLASESDLLCFGTAEAGRTVAVSLYEDEDFIRTSETTVDEDGNWKLNLKPNIAANAMVISVDGVRVQKYENISYRKSVLSSPANGIQVFLDGVEQKALVTEAGSQVIASLPDADATSMDVVVRCNGHRSVKILPTSAGIEGTSDGNEVRFTVDTFPIKLSVKFDGSDSKSVQLFLYPYDNTDVTALDSHVIYFAAGEYTVSTEMHLGNNQTLYLDDGAILHARISTENANNVKIMGKGIIDTYPFEVEVNMLTFKNCQNVTLKDFTLVGPRKWMVKMEDCDDVLVSTMNIMGTEMNSDGVDIVGCQNLTVEKCYLRNNDDCITVKSFGRDVKNIKIIGNVFFNDVYGNAMEIGYETRAESISDILFENNDVIQMLGGSVFSIHLGDRANVSNVTYRNIRVEAVRTKLVEFFIKETQYTQDAGRGSITNVTFENISVTSETFGSVTLNGYDDDHTISNVQFNNITHKGETIAATGVVFYTNQFISNVTWNNVAIN